MSDTETPVKRGRPPFEITDDVLKKVERYAAQGLADYQIGLLLGLHKATMVEKKKDFPEFSEAIEQGRAKGIGTITNSLFNAASGGDVGAMKYFLNNRDKGNWKDKINHDLTSGDKPIHTDIQVTLVSADGKKQETYEDKKKAKQEASAHGENQTEDSSD